MQRFAHESEQFFAALLDHYGIKWEYEGKTFVLRIEDGVIKKAFTPDFYLPEFNIYIEVTVMKKATRKRKKIDQTRAKYPETYIMLVDRDGINELAEEHKFLSEVLTST